MEPNLTDANCHVEKTEHILIKFLLLVVVTPVITTFGLCGNGLSVLVLAKPRMRSPSNTYLIAISCSDFLTLVMTLLLYSTETAIDYWNDVELVKIWIAYLKQIYVVSHCGPLMTVYFSVAATFERWFALIHPDSYMNWFSVKKRATSIASIVFFSILFSTGKYYEFDIITYENCNNLARFQLIRSYLSESSIYFQAYTVWLGSLASFVIPFVLLLIMNTIIAVKIHEKVEESNPPGALKPYFLHFMDVKRKARRREATIVTVAVVFAFLICNSPSFLLTLVEYINMDFLENHRLFYGFAKDTLTVLTTISCSINVILYVIHNRAFRKQLKLLFRKNRKSPEDQLASSICGPDEPDNVLLLKKISQVEKPMKLMPKPQAGVDVVDNKIDTPRSCTELNAEIKQECLPEEKKGAANSPNSTRKIEPSMSSVSDIVCEVIPANGGSKGRTLCKISVTVHIGER